MSTVLVNRVQSAYSRPSHRSKTEGQDAHHWQRSVSSISAHQSFANSFDQSTLRTPESSTLSPPPYSARRRRIKTTSISTIASARLASRKLLPEEVQSLVQSLGRDDTYIVQIDCLAEYRTLVQTIDLRRTPVDCEILCALQQRENRIVQRNACRDKRFRSLIESLEPYRIREGVEQNNSDNGNHPPMPEYPPTDLSY